MTRREKPQSLLGEIWIPCVLTIVTCWGMLYTSITGALSAHRGHWVGFWLCAAAVVALGVFFKTFAQTTLSIYFDHWRRE